ncbi:hypothetical protein [Acetobacter oeni]|uniref:Uncharacterized protein n=1 Tax=Acetobacter oeni TaxID=304077 RepID=A0A511XI28_9PROT|nr:hypothetical protein [Acetobacter oeni]MBB3883019.1 hypothetical protein [Acetobacter oeni]NHO19095.1 hypothetical protein [Acetobacter oeni]GBR11641.1 hypothetical protein AA21952_3415 [Acetobacter oeni LMG 21952]GEN62603.1 hypothetical protein AOE01nite_08270 [Acetobacter oeni]
MTGDNEEPAASYPLNPVAERAFFERRFAELIRRNQEQDLYIRGLRALVSSLEQELSVFRAKNPGETEADPVCSGKPVKDL